MQKSQSVGGTDWGNDANPAKAGLSSGAIGGWHQLGEMHAKIPIGGWHRLGKRMQTPTWRRR